MAGTSLLTLGLRGLFLAATSWLLEPFPFVKYMQTSLHEDSPINTLVAIVACPAGQSYNYSLVQTYPKSPVHFVLHEGLLFTSNTIDYEEASVINLTATCTIAGDTTINTVTFITVNVLDLNDNSPTFRQSVYEAIVPESTEPGTQIIQVEAIDNDNGRNGEVRYTIDPNDMLEVDSYTGVIRLAPGAVLDRDITPTFDVMVSGYDNVEIPALRLTGSTLIHILVQEDGNDCPFFEDLGPFLARYSESVGATFANIEALDYTPGTPITYAISYDESSPGTKDIFGMHPDSGEIYVKSSLEEKVGFYNLTVTATDNGCLTSAIAEVQVARYFR